MTKPIIKKAWAILDPKKGIIDIFLTKKGRDYYENTALHKILMSQFKQKIIEIEIKYNENNK